MKKIIHFQIPLNEYGTPAIPLDTFRAFMKYVSDVIGDEYYVIATPLIPDNKKDIINIDFDSLKDTSEKDLAEVINSKIEENLNNNGE